MSSEDFGEEFFGGRGRPAANSPGMHAVITAGGLVEGAFAATIGSSVKALAPFGAATLLDRAIDAARESGARGIAVVGGPEVLDHCRGRVDRAIDADADGGTNVLRALEAWPGEPLLYLTSDLPFVDGPSLRDFIDRSAGYGLTMPLANAVAYETRFPSAPDHVSELGGERVANGSAFYIAREAIEPLRRHAAAFFNARKSKLRMALLLGPVLIFRFATRSLTIEAIERRASGALGVAAAAIRDAAPELCFDVDTLEDYRYACGVAAPA